MGKFDSLLDKVGKSASDRDAGTAKEKCPKKKKPAIFVAVARGDTGDAVSGIKIDISKPTKTSITTGGDGEAKSDPAKKGKHNVQIILSDDQKKKFAAPPALSVQAAAGQTTVVFFIVEPLPTLLIEVKDGDGKPVDGVRVRAGLLPEMTTAGGKADFTGVPAGKYRIGLSIPKPLETKTEVFSRGVSTNVFEPGYTLGWDALLAPGDTTSFQVTLARVRSVDFILAEEGTDKPIAEAKIYCKLPGGAKAVVTTDQLGGAKVTFAQDGKVEVERIELRQSGQVTKVETR